MCSETDSDLNDLMTDEDFDRDVVDTTDTNTFTTLTDFNGDAVLVDGCH